MKKLKFDFKYTPSINTDIRATIRAAQRRMEAEAEAKLQKEQQNNVAAISPRRGGAAK